MKQVRVIRRDARSERRGCYSHPGRLQRKRIPRAGGQSMAHPSKSDSPAVKTASWDFMAQPDSFATCRASRTALLGPLYSSVRTPTAGVPKFSATAEVISAFEENASISAEMRDRLGHFPHPASAERDLQHCFHPEGSFGIIRLAIGYRSDRSENAIESGLKLRIKPDPRCSVRGGFPCGVISQSAVRGRPESATRSERGPHLPIRLAIWAIVGLNAKPEAALSAKIPISF